MMKSCENCEYIDQPDVCKFCDSFGMHEKIQAERRKLWCDVAVAVANSSNCTNPDSPKGWADLTLKRFDEKFNKEPK